MKTVLFVPGSSEDIHSRDYSSVIKAIEAKGYSVRFVPITWLRTTIVDWENELNTVYSSYESNETILAGFSFGAMTAYVVAAKRNPSELWLFSLSPYFAEDINSKNQKKSWLDRIGHRRGDAFRELVFEKSASSVTCKTLLFYGTNELDEWPVMNERAEGARELLMNSHYIPILGVGHDVADAQYIKAIQDTV